jgi:hypothetical protein
MRKLNRPPAHLGYHDMKGKQGWHKDESKNTYGWYKDGKRMETIQVVPKKIKKKMNK